MSSRLTLTRKMFFQILKMSCRHLDLKQNKINFIFENNLILCFGLKAFESESLTIN